MKKYFAIALLLTTPAFAGNMPSEAEMKEAMKQMEAMKKQGMKVPNFDPRMMEAGMGMGQCMQEKLGEEGMNRMAAKSEKYAAEIDALCDAGKEDEALQLAKDYGKQMQDDPDVKAARACSEKYKDVLKGSATTAEKIQRGETLEKKDICSHLTKHKPAG